jgi:hypothetical protein
MIRFWFRLLFELPDIESYKYIMRLDDDSQLLGKWFNVFQEMDDKKAVYFANEERSELESILPGTVKLKSVTFAFKEMHQLVETQPENFRRAFSAQSVQLFYNNFEVMKVSFFKRDEVFEWIKAIDAAHGIFYYRWGDAILRYITLALFAKKDEVLHRVDYNLSYCHPC